MGEKTKVIVIGAGISGLSAGLRLQHYGYDVTILEARDRTGGRMHTKKDPGWPALDIGASWVCGVWGNPIEKLAEQYNAGLKRTKGDDKSIVVYDDTKKKADGSPTILNTTLKKIGIVWRQLMAFVDKKEARDKLTENLGEIFRQGLEKLKPTEQEKKELDYGKSLLENDWGASIKQLSAKLWDHIGYILPGGQDVCKNGYGKITDGLAEEFAKKGKILTNNVVKKMEYNTTGVKVTTRENEIFEAKYVICTLPVGVLLKNYTELFLSNLPLPTEKVHAMNVIQMGKFHKTYLKFDEVFWDDDKQWINYVSDKEKGHWNQFLTLEKITGEPILLGLNQAKYAEELENKPVEEIKKEALEVLRRIHGDKTPEKCEIIVSHWIGDEFSCGAYSYTGVGASLDDYDHLAAPLTATNGENRIFFAGEATTKYYPATVHGAYMTGLREANRLYAFDNNKFRSVEEYLSEFPEEKEWRVFPEQVIPPAGKDLIAHVDKDDKIPKPVFAEKIAEDKYRVEDKQDPVVIDGKEWINSMTSTPDDYFP